jgi:hypothetical protein
LVFGGISEEGQKGKSIVVTCVGKHEVRLRERESYQTNFTSDQLTLHNARTLTGITSNAILDFRTKGLKNVVSIEVGDLKKEVNIKDYF